MNSKPSILLVNPPIYDFAAFDFWLKPLGMLTAARNIDADFTLFDFLDRTHSFYNNKPKYADDQWGRGSFYSLKIRKPNVFKDIPRNFRRFGLPAEIFSEFLKANKSFDLVFIQTVMTYWYLGYKEVIEAVRTYWPKTKIILGGPYTRICAEHAKSIGCDLFSDRLLDSRFRGNDTGMPRWDLYKNPKTVAMKITQGCPFKCTYCTVPVFCDGFSAKPYEQIIREFDYIVSLGIENIAFYDDALLYKSDEVIQPFLRYIIGHNIKINFQTPNALNARFIDDKLAALMVEAGFKTFYLGFESSENEFHKQTGSKIIQNEFEKAVKSLLKSGAERKNITAYLILGHPKYEIQDIEQSVKYVNGMGIRCMLADFSPIPGTPDGKLCEKYVDMAEPLMHNKTVFPIKVYGADKVNHIKDLCRSLNRKL